MENDGSNANTRSVGDDQGGSLWGFKLSDKLRARMERLEDWRIDPCIIKFPESAREYHGGHATVSRAMLVDDDDLNDSCTPEESDDEEKAEVKGVDDTDSKAEEEDDDSEDQDKEQESEYASDSESSELRAVVAVKKLRMADDMDLERVIGLAVREAEFLVVLRHENIVEFKGFIEDGSKDIFWLVFSWAENGNLRDFVDSYELEIPERISLIYDVASGLDYLHGQNPPICHGDLKSANVLVNSGYRAVITDFGSARRLAKRDLDRQTKEVESPPSSAVPLQATFSTSSKTITLTGNKYTLRWAAPELLKDDQMSLWSDMWAWGWIAYEAMTNSIPFQDVTAEAIVVERVIRGDLPSITDDARLSLIRGLCSLMITCWNNSPTERPKAIDCLNSMVWMPKIIPEPGRTKNRAASRTLSPGLLMQLGYMYILQGKYAHATLSLTEALQICTDVGDTQGRANALRLLAEVQRSQKEYTEAITLYTEAIQSYTDTGDREGRASALWGLAEAHQARKEYTEAIALYTEALQIHTDIGNKEDRASNLEGLAAVHRLQEKYSDAVGFYTEALQIHTDIDHKEGRASALYGLAEVHRLQEKYSDAIGFYNEALQIHTEVGYKEGRASALYGLAEVHRLQEKYSDAIAFYAEGLQILADVGCPRDIADTLLGLAKVYGEQDHHEQAVHLYETAADILQDIGDSKAAVSALERAVGSRRLLKLQASQDSLKHPDSTACRPQNRDDKRSVYTSQRGIKRKPEENDILAASAMPKGKRIKLKS